ncbi:DUF4168 domain-containing protein [Planktothrix sp. FACHB-1355]|uniref:DUF4168 domain-containing protein n=1 Tax=Aerosakkonema funiforme FACHB-1375 TaxID=2949571 RepID=A0A926VG02_9CYAN|nr:MULTISPECIES: DUF4168 domain-containing protein [Oscillatoriales]MBD2183047.1 DUF4168 domain-containing protein [Aerosakkonema funiforme FACHB-1375]MBD3557769.1 DUF4168 domain-containing protein [Planktothrix sp. FACHB-1355]
MTNSSVEISRLYPNRMLSKSIVVALLSTLGLLCSVTPDLSASTPTLMFSSAATAQAVSDDEVSRFARAGFAIEKRRQAVVEEIKARTGGNVPDINCYPPEKVESLPANIRDEVKQFCDFSRQTIQANQFSVGRFLEIRDGQNSDPTLKQRIDRELLRLQSR